ncbi:uncharacterized protein LOC114357588 [Ostrinia furnacalis]|uniref:uncharacterized protein LOC114357588 n=1 Tax=Ostrinia furnacalis TaxID=93504 RepID=UPI00103FD28C|nr:uncharacterized protein LOC114357588 [Ostrinia furnacalis]
MGVKTFWCCFLLFVSFVRTRETQDQRFSLQQVVILSRHGLRTPLSKYLADMTPRTWPTWKEKPGYLTAKGKILEGYMGRFFSVWLSQEGLLTENCPSEDIFYVYANTKQRTRASALAFVKNAFPKCNITIHTSNTEVDPVFNPVIHNKSAIFRDIVIDDMKAQFKTLSLNNSYKDLDLILDFKNSEICRDEHKCNLATDKNKAYVVSGEKPNISGPLKIGNSVVDAFVMQYYEGFPLNDVAWGCLKSPKEWQSLMRLSRSYHNIIFNSTLVAKDIAQPLIKFMSNIFLNDSVPKISLLMGHDANMYTVLNSLDFKPYSLENQHELTPIGGKIVFQKWFDNIKKEELLKIHYVYQSYRQLRQSSELSLENPPQFKLLELNQCEIDENGFCSWSDFEKIIESLKES